MHFRCLLLPFLIALSVQLSAQINRKAVVNRHNVTVTKADSLSSITVGNGRFAFTVDATGLQTFPVEYSKGISLGTESQWGWHSFVDTSGYKINEALKTYHVNGRDISYVTQHNEPQRKKDVSNWFRQNPHRLQLGNIGFHITKKDGTEAGLLDIKDIRQELDLWSGEIRSRFSLEGVVVNVSTVCGNSDDVIGVKVSSELLKQGRLKIKLVFPYPTGAWTDEGANYTNSANHSSEILLSHENGGVIERVLDTTRYYIGLRWEGQANIRKLQPHQILISPAPSSGAFSFSATFHSQKNFSILPDFAEVKSSSEDGWKNYWLGGGFIDFAGSTDERAAELERRIILSQYLMKAMEAGPYPPQETGLIYNSWFGKPHLEMTWWHASHWALWGKKKYTEDLLSWYSSVADKAKQIAARQGFSGVRWQKMTDNNGDESPSSVGAMLIWQQPHYIYFAEQCYRITKNPKTLEKYKDLLFATADFMASFAHYDSATQRFILGKGLIPAQERFKPEQTFNPTYELVYWKWALTVAQQWRERLKLKRNPHWDRVIKSIAALPIQDHKYLFAESAKDSYTNPEFRTDHPSVLAALGVMPSTGQVNNAVMQNTFNWIWSNWTWSDTWGWDFPMTAMTATRLGMPDKAIDALLMPIQTNTYLLGGHNYQDQRLRTYMPGNGGLLTAIAMMVAGYDGAKEAMPGIPNNGKWKVRWEGLNKMP